MCDLLTVREFFVFRQNETQTGLKMKLYSSSRVEQTDKNICPKENQVLLFSKSHTKNFYFYTRPTIYNIYMYVIHHTRIIRFKKPNTRSMASNAKLSKITIPGVVLRVRFSRFSPYLDENIYR